MMDRIVSGLSESSIKVRLAAVRYNSSRSCQVVSHHRLRFTSGSRVVQVEFPTFRGNEQCNTDGYSKRFKMKRVPLQVCDESMYFYIVLPVQLGHQSLNKDGKIK